VTKEQLKKYRDEKNSIQLLKDEIEKMCGETVHDYGYDYTKGFKRIIHLEGFNQELYEQRLASDSESIQRGQVLEMDSEEAWKRVGRVCPNRYSRQIF